MEKTKINHCKTCEHFYNKQRELNYAEDNGFCLNPLFNYNTVDGRIVGIIDRDNLRNQIEVSGNPSHDIESKLGLNIKFSQYSLQVQESFGCIFYEKSKN